ncbi:succinate--CoA ligase subunit beta, partial [Staphylococcus aureus]
MFRSRGVAVPEGRVALTAEAAVEKAKELNSDVYVVKAPIDAGGEGKAGGVKIAKSLSEVETYAKELIGKTLVPHQTCPEGIEIKRLY